MNRIRTLDGLRGAAILMVVAGHAAANYPAISHETRGWLVCFANSGMGVRLFFALSGYLITELLLRELENRGTIHLGDFYLRRAYRILPAFYVFLGLLALWITMDGASTQLPMSAWIAAGSFTWNYSFLWTNYGAADLWNLAHTWSLAVEVQFYLLWPALLIWLRPQRVLVVALVLIALSPLIRVGSYAVFPDHRGYLRIMLHTGFDGILAGCVAAILVRRTAVMSFIRRYRTAAISIALAWIFLMGPIATHAIRGFPIVAGLTLDAIAAAWLVAVFHRCPPAWTTRFMGTGLMPALGVISYSLYLWQQVFLNSHGWLAEGRLWLPVAAAVATAFVSYLGIERPFLRGRFSTTRSPSPMINNPQS